MQRTAKKFTRLPACQPHTNLSPGPLPALPRFTHMCPKDYGKIALNDIKA